MKKHVLRLSLLAALTASASFAETYNVKVPFDFVLGNKTTPAGQYVVDTAAGSNALVIRSADHKLSFAIIGSSLASTQDAPNGKLVFHRYGHRSFLEQVWARGGAGCALPKMHEERELMAHGNIQETRTTIALR